ncbi:MAG: outer membrane protein transport protein [Candidatus Aminicenantes bacterium]|nr:outer membrane protein transport protein [Candidatus Aminicenantes bacterium]
MSKRTSVLALTALLALTSFASANGLNLNGLGTRAQSMGGAFVGVADDFSAVFWNPAGAAAFRQTTFGFCAVDLIPKATYRFEYEISIPEINPLIDATTQVSHYLGFLGAYYKPIGPKIVVGLGIGTPSGFGTLWDGDDFLDLTGGTPFDRSSKVGLFSISPLVAVSVNEWLSVGATLNINHGIFSLKRPGGNASIEPGQMVDLGQYEENMNGWGFGATFGVMARPIEALSVGLTVRTPSTISFEGLARLSYLPLHDLPGTSDLERKITWPLWIAGGVSFRPVDRLLLSADVHWTQWSKIDRLTTDYLDPFWADLFTTGGIDSSSMRLSWENALQVRFGAEYALNPTMSIRAGYTRDPAPGPDSTLNVLLPTFTFNAFSAGVGKTIGNLQLDFGLEYLAGQERTPMPDFWLDILQGFGTYDMNIVVPSISIQYRF